VNAVKTQIWIAVSVYVLVAIVRKRLARPGAEPLPTSTDFEPDAFRENAHLQALQASDSQEELIDPGNQLILFDF